MLRDPTGSTPLGLSSCQIWRRWISRVVKPMMLGQALRREILHANYLVAPVVIDMPSYFSTRISFLLTNSSMP